VLGRAKPDRGVAPRAIGDATLSRDGARPGRFSVRVGIAGAGVDARPVGTEVLAGLGRCEVPADEPAHVGAPFGEVER
jgi:hypothetical protein